MDEVIYKRDFEDSDDDVAPIFNLEIWKKYLSYISLMEDTFSLAYQNAKTAQFQDIFIAGSLGEGIKTISACTEKPTDFDFMLRDKRYVAIERHVQQERNHSNVCVLKIENSELYPGYALLRITESRELSPSYLSSRHFFTSNLSYITPLPEGNILIDPYARHGPALMCQFFFNAFQNLNPDTDTDTDIDTDIDTDYDVLELDFVAYIHCDEWPSVADEWIERKRRDFWPSRTMIANIVKMGCDLVPSGAHGSINQSNEWRISFARAERYLIHEMNSAQLQTYVLLQIISKKNTYGESFHQIVDSYIFKTAFFWTSEKRDGSQWDDRHYTKYVRFCLEELLQLVREGNCPNFFMRNCNILRTKLDDDQRINFSRELENSISDASFKQMMDSLVTDARSKLCESDHDSLQTCFDSLDAFVKQNWKENFKSFFERLLPTPTGQRLNIPSDFIEALELD